MDLTQRPSVSSMDTKAKDWTVVQQKARVKPKYITREKALTFQRELDIMGLAPLLMSIESRNLQEDGWSFEGIMKKDNEAIFVLGNVKKKKIPTKSYITLPVENKWEDQALFSRTK